MDSQDVDRYNDACMQDALTRILVYLHDNMTSGIAHLSEVTSNISIGSIDVANDVDLLVQNNISMVLSLLTTSLSQDTITKYKNNNIQRIGLYLEDDPRVNLDDTFQSTYDIIHKACCNNNKILVHCEAGVSRSVTVVAHYLLVRYYLTNFTPKLTKRTKDLTNPRNYHIYRIMRMIKDVRGCALPNRGFLRQLIFVEHKLKVTYSKLLPTDQLESVEDEILGDDIINASSKYDQLSELAELSKLI